MRTTWIYQMNGTSFTCRTDVLTSVSRILCYTDEFLVPTSSPLHHRASVFLRPSADLFTCGWVVLLRRTSILRTMQPSGVLSCCVSPASVLVVSQANRPPAKLNLLTCQVKRNPEEKKSFDLFSRKPQTRPPSQ